MRVWEEAERHKRELREAEERDSTVDNEPTVDKNTIRNVKKNKTK